MGPLQIMHRYWEMQRVLMLAQIAIALERRCKGPWFRRGKPASLCSRYPSQLTIWVLTVLTKQIRAEADLQLRVQVQNSQVPNWGFKMFQVTCACQAVAVQVFYKVHVSLAKAPHTNMSQKSSIWVGQSR